eukprot:gnl/TRDRNA2_/TRDRNA2_178653_c0_seq1.p1 gnl/TRDRNA2_/TRDRNA2_178653_c0~~gnl/TRDRNA2_/TRDRNA2_178653_c0_seq1.p1  ORF type:complete len:253 (-),score=85.51 gnl/TRDRNA2_/TRDRNA2_178653_c0_seq1:223-981(-)
MGQEQSAVSAREVASVDARCETGDSCRMCSSSDPAADTVKVNAAVFGTNAFSTMNKENASPQAAAAKVNVDKAEAALREHEEKARQLEDDIALQRQVALQKAREETELRIRQEQEQKEREEAERIQREHQQQEQERRKHEEELAAARKEREACERAEEEKQMQEAKAKVEAFLKAKGFKSVDGKRRKLMSTTYPLHTAVKENNAEMVQLLMRSGADVRQKNSSGQTPQDIARKCNKRGSHDAVLSILSSAIA